MWDSHGIQWDLMVIYLGSNQDKVGIKFVSPKTLFYGKILDFTNAMDISCRFQGDSGVHGGILTYVIWVPLQMRDSTFYKLAMSGKGRYGPPIKTVLQENRRETSR